MVQRGTMSMLGIIGAAVPPIGEDVMPGMPMPGMPMPVRSIIIVFVIDPYSSGHASRPRPSIGRPPAMSEGDYTWRSSDCNDFIAFAADLSANRSLRQSGADWYTFHSCAGVSINVGAAMSPLVGVIMGSRSDWETLRHAAQTLESLGVPHEVCIISAHRTPDALFDYAAKAAGRGIEVIVAGAGGAAHLPGMTAAKTTLPVLGVPIESAVLRGVDSLLSIVQMPAGIPVGTLAIGRAGAINAALLAAAILGGKYPAYRAAVEQFRAKQTQDVLNDPDPRTGEQA
jgi:5-(carboxyamino)imidazole ribonucleotide mutase